MSQTKRIRIEQPGNPLCKIFHSNMEISEGIEIFDRPLRESSEAPLGRVGVLGTQLVREIIAMAGITSITVSPYSLNVFIGDAFDWDQCRVDAVVAVLKRVAFGAEPDDESVKVAAYLPLRQAPLKFNQEQASWYKDADVDDVN